MLKAIYIYISNETNRLHDVYSKFACSEIYLVCVCVQWFLQLLLVCCAFLLGLLCGAGGVIVYIKCSRKTPRTSQSSHPAPLYDDIELPTTTKHEVEHEHSVAYGHLN